MDRLARDTRGRPGAGALWPLLLVALVACLDLIADAGSRSTAEIGFLDEPAHLATGVLVILALLAILPARPAIAFLAAALVASVAIDLDHIPQYLGWQFLTEGSPRPYTHSLLTPLVLCAAGALAKGRVRAVLLGAAVGVCAHLLRDLATASGVALFWPLSSGGVRIPYWTYMAALALAASVVSAALVSGRLTIDIAELSRYVRDLGVPRERMRAKRVSASRRPLAARSDHQDSSSPPGGSGTRTRQGPRSDSGSRSAAGRSPGARTSPGS